MCAVNIISPCVFFLPSSGYDSVEGEPGEDLNYDEVVVYNNDQAVPSYLIIYSLPVREG